MSNCFPDFRDHWALYQWWEPVVVAHAVRCSRKLKVNHSPQS